MHVNYYFFKYLINLCLFAYHHKIKVVGKNNIPKKEAILFISNHPNAFLDPILIATNNVRSLYFLSRASAFKNKLIAKFLNTVHMIPVFRKRDGANSLAKNKATFSKSAELMYAEKTIFIAAEGSHNIQRRIRPLKKGFAYIILDTFKKYPEMDIKIIPVGLNYSSITGFPSSVSINYGKPISAKKYYNKNDRLQTIRNLATVVSNALKTVTVHIDDTKNYDKTLKKLKALKVDFTNPIETNKIINSIDNYTVSNKNSSVKNKKNILNYLFVLNNLLPLFIWKKIKKTIKELEFISTYRFAVGVLLFPIYHFICSLLIKSFLETKIAVIYFIASIFVGLLYIKTTKPSL